jgi:hypothetical protein
MQKAIGTLPLLALAAGFFALQACGSSEAPGEKSPITPATRGSSPDGGPGAFAQEEPDEFSKAYAHALCDDAARCCQKNEIQFDANACVTRPHRSRWRTS